MGHCRATLREDGRLDIREEHPKRDADGRPAPGEASKAWLYEDARLLRLDDRTAVFVANGWEMSFPKVEGRVDRVWPCKIVLTW